jgi:hypothetical protein
MSAGTSVSGGIGGIFYATLLLYGIISKSYKRHRAAFRSHPYALFGSVILTFLVLISFNLNNWGLVDFQNTASIIIQEGKDLVISTAKGLFDNVGTSVETVMLEIF